MTDHFIDDAQYIEDQDIGLEDPPPRADAEAYTHRIADLPTPSGPQIDDFVQFVAQAKSWYKHLPATPPGAPLFFYLDPNAGRDRLRRWGHQVTYRDRTPLTERVHYTWMTTADYRRRFGYLAFSSPHVTSIWMDEMLQDGTATLDPNVGVPLVEIEPGQLMLVPETVLESGKCMVTRAVHPRADAASLWRARGVRSLLSDTAHGSTPQMSERWTDMLSLCRKLATASPLWRRLGRYEHRLNRLIDAQRTADHESMRSAIHALLKFLKT